MIFEKFFNRITSIEYIITEKCQNSCKYCYRVLHHNTSSTITVTVEHIKTVTDNLISVFNLDETFFVTRRAELYGGDPLLDFAFFRRVVKTLLDSYKYGSINVPTNARTISSLNYKDLENFMYNYSNVHFSLSVDSPFQDANRPLSKFGKMMGFEKNINYKYLFSIAKKFTFGFHPMLYFETVDKWYSTFRFFFDNDFIPYLLEVRHPSSYDNYLMAIKQLIKIRFDLDKIKMSKDYKRSANTVYPSTVPRGLGCSALTTLTIMPDGNVPFCHRVIGNNAYSMMNLKEKTYDINKMVLWTSGYDFRNYPKCITCPIRNICGGPCPGMQFEYWGNPWMVYDSFCDYIRLKVYFMASYFKDWLNTLLRHQVEKDRVLLKKYIYQQFSSYNLFKTLENNKRFDIAKGEEL